MPATSVSISSRHTDNGKTDNTELRELNRLGVYNTKGFSFRAFPCNLFRSRRPQNHQGDPTKPSLEPTPLERTTASRAERTDAGRGITAESTAAGRGNTIWIFWIFSGFFVCRN